MLSSLLKRQQPWLFMLVFMAALGLRLLAYNPGEARLVGDSWRVAIWCVLPLLWLTTVEQRGVVSAFYPLQKRSYKHAIFAAAALICLIIIGYRLTFHHWTGIPPNRHWTEYAAVVPSIVLVGFAEEFVFRGVFLSGLIRTEWKPIKALVATNIMFAASHYPGWLAGSGTMTPIDWVTASIRLFIFGMAMSGLVTLEGGLLLAVFVHSFNDAWVGLFLS